MNNRRILDSRPSKRPTDQSRVPIDLPREDPQPIFNEHPNAPQNGTIRTPRFFTLSDGYTINAENIDIIEPEENGQVKIHIGGQMLLLNKNEISCLLEIISNQ